MARPKTSVDRLANLRKTFQANKGKVLSAKQVADAVGAAYWRACIKDLKAEGLNIESVREGRAVVGYKYVDIKDAAASPKKAEVKAAVAASKPKKAVKKTAKKADKPVKAKGKPAAKAKAEKPVKAETVVVDETPAGEEDPDVLAILQQAGLAK